MEPKIMVLAGSWRVIASWCWDNNIKKETFEKDYVFARDIEDVRGRVFSGFIKLWNYEDTPGLDAICDFITEKNIPSITTDEM